MNILITGANGFLARNLLAHYKTYDDVHCVGLGRHSGCDSYQYEFFCADVLDYEVIEKTLCGRYFDVVIHLAALTAHSAIVDNKFESLDINLHGTENMLRWFNRHCSNALFVYASTGKVYGGTNESPISENAKVNPLNVLGKSKLITERIVDFYAVPYNKYLITRIFNVYGADQKSNFVVPTIVNQLKQGDNLVLGNVSDKRDYLYIDDLISAIVGCITYRDKFAPLDIVNIGSGVPLSVMDIIETFEKVLRRKISVHSDSARYRKDEMEVEYCDNSKLRILTGWQAEFDIEAGIKAICRCSGLI